MTRKPCARELVLLAMYVEYAIDEGDFDRITGPALGLSDHAFIWALMCLRTEGYIEGVLWISPLERDPAKLAAGIGQKRLTQNGIITLESFLGLTDKSRAEKAEKASELFVEIGSKARGI